MNLNKFMYSVGQVFPDEYKLKTLEKVLSVAGMKSFEYCYSPKALGYKCRMSYEGFNYDCFLQSATLRNASIFDIANQIIELVTLEQIDGDPEYELENENEQAMLDAARDYGFV